MFVSGGRKFRLYSRGLTVFVAASAAASLAAAQEPRTATAEEILVTAQKREQRAFDVPISLSVISGQQALESGVSSTLDLARLTPGLSIGQNSGEGDFPFISLRGVAMRDFADTNESPSAVYINEFYKANLMGLDSQMFDIQRVEVLRGPQGTLYGRNATGGLIHFIAAAPTDYLSGYVSAMAGERSRYKFEAAVGGPIAGALSGRLSVYHHEFDGYIKNTFPGGQDGNALNASAVRGQLQYDFSDDARASLLLQYYRNDNDAGNMFTHIAVTQNPVTGLSTRNPGGLDAFGFGDSAPMETNSNRDIFLLSEQFTAIGKIELSLGAVDLVSITGYESGFKDATFDSDSTPGPRGTEVHPDAEQFSQEVRLSGQAGAATWVAGVYYFDYGVDGFQRRITSAAVGPRAPVFYDLQSESWAVFANVDFALSDTLTATGGLRYTDEEKEYSLRNTDTGPIFTPATVGDLARRDDANTSFTARLSWEPTPQQLFYAGVARSYKAGTFNVGYTPIPTAAISVKPEELTSYEIGAKLSSADNRLSVSGAIFYYDYKDSQAFQFDGQTLSSTTFNRDAEITGLEVELVARPVDGLSFTGSLTYLDATLLDVQLPGLANNGPIVDTEMPLAPEWSANLTGRYNWAAPWGGTFGLQGDVSYKGEQYFDAFNSPSQLEGAYTLTNVRASWTDETDSLTLAVFAENVADVEYRTAAFDLAFLGLATEVWGKPRWVGVSLSYNFGQ
ncbi:MAG: TonB-dependent receptor [Hyphomonadaceae bacterium]|nr:TonB-dependent receptor [Hyphomonadaceae bacterium]